MTWISIDSTLPPIDEESFFWRASFPVLVAIEGYHRPIIAYWGILEQDGEIIWHEKGREDCKIKGKVTHWMPLPEMPY
jgi:hypothetical protein